MWPKSVSRAGCSTRAVRVGSHREQENLKALKYNAFLINATSPKGDNSFKRRSERHSRSFWDLLTVSPDGLHGQLGRIQGML